MNGDITLIDIREEQMQLKYATDNLTSFTRLKDQNQNDEKDLTPVSLNELLKKCKYQRLLQLR